MLKFRVGSLDVKQRLQLKQFCISQQQFEQFQQLAGLKSE
ncbi:hypothetical protein RNAN_0098 [Rheinheimera nanhaiensis E407-8]|uniref:Uncharacterized protein n=1 Tax=Rheinheimera nanhaiensis E407-8 TaxID=562729 RepID=I1DSV7_9GAMM|nr:hypothetical protein RNAN_0098 [Rheinheimera nanhaiensis E407-8]